MKNIYLKQLSKDDGKNIFLMLQRIKPGADKFNNLAYGLTFKEFKRWLIEQDNWSKGKKLPKGYVPQFTYWLFIDNTPIGYGKLRIKLTKNTRKFGGHIGFAIDPLYRSHGYGTIFLTMLLKEARKKKINTIRSTVEKNNLPSKIVHIKCNGKIVKEDKLRWHFVFK